MSPLLRSFPWLLLAATAQAAPEPVPLYREIKDWVVACDNQRTCQAIGAVEYPHSPLRMEVHREAGPAGHLQLRLIYAGQTDYFPLFIDDRPLSDELADALRLKPSDDALILSAEGDAVQHLLAELRNGNQLRMAVDAEVEAVVSLAGLSASLLLMDSVQGRLDTRGALYRPGERANSEVPEAPALPRLRPYPGVQPMADEEARRIAQAVLESTRSEWTEDDPEATPEAEAFPLNPQEALVLIRTSCAAYQCNYSLYRVERRQPYAQRPLQIEPLPLDGGALSGAVGYDPRTGSLGYLMKGRGLADCGEAGSWRFDGERFQAESLSLMRSCAGGNPGEWPVLWRVAE